MGVWMAFSHFPLEWGQGRGGTCRGRRLGQQGQAGAWGKRVLQALLVTSGRVVQELGSQQFKNTWSNGFCCLLRSFENSVCVSIYRCLSVFVSRRVCRAEARTCDNKCQRHGHRRQDQPPYVTSSCFTVHLTGKPGMWSWRKSVRNPLPVTWPVRGLSDSPLETGSV